jgi:polyketide synthase PksN
LSKLLENAVSSTDLEGSFLELGINSVLAVELVEALNEKLGIDLGIEVVFDYRGAKELTEYIAGEFFAGKTLEQLSIDIEEIKACAEADLTVLSKEEIESKIKEVMSGLLKNGVNLPDLDKSFMELGLTAELMEGVNEKLGIDLGIEKVFDYRGASELAEFIFIHYGNGFHKDLPEESLPAVEDSLGAYESDEHADVIAGVGRDDIIFRDAGSETKNVEIAIIGISGKFAESETIEEFWKHLQAGDDCIKEINRSGWLEKSFMTLIPPTRINP